MKRIMMLCVLVISLITFGCNLSTDLTLGSSASYGSGVAEDTLITKSDTSEKRISSLTFDDYVLSNNRVSKKVKNTYMQTEIKLVLIRTNTGRSLLVGGDQPIKTNFGWILVKDMQLGAFVYCINGLEMVVQVNIQTYNSKTYNIEFDEEIGMYANGVLIGDYSMMRRMNNNEIDYPDA